MSTHTRDSGSTPATPMLATKTDRLGAAAFGSRHNEIGRPRPADASESATAGGALENRASKGNSPYVRAHADSPVKWQLLDDQAVSRAKSENKLLFLNVGFSSCHYCHLTTQDSFSHPSVAVLLNEAFIPVIVDREERPDIDTIYMNYIQAVNWVGGWPINVFLTPELEPVFGGTYWPGPGSEHDLDSGNDDSRLDFLVILQKMADVWREQEARCRKEAKEIVSQLRDFAAEGTFGARSIDAPTSANASNVAAAVRKGDSSSTSTLAGPSAAVTNFNTEPHSTRPSQDLELDLDQLEEAFTHVAGAFDAVNGGFGAEPKFPTPARLSFLLRLSQFPSAVADVVGDTEVRHATLMVLHTLRHIRDGGLRDHVGSGFARYSATVDWAMPHFEKMVADNALLLGVYLDAWLGQSTEKGHPDKDGEFADVVFELADYLTSPPIQREDGGFVSSEAADSFYRKGDRHMREGAYYLWTRREFDAVVDGDSLHGQQSGALAAAHWNVLQHGNVPREHDPQDEFMNLNVLSVAKSVWELSKQFGMPVEEVKRIIASAKEKLFAHRQKERVRPETDDKVVASYNGLAISALARTAAAIRPIDTDRSAKYLDAATKAAGFISDKLWDADNKVLFRSFYESRSDTRGFADDYAFLIEGLLDLFEATGEEKWLKWADELQETQIKLFYDPPASPGLPAVPQPQGSSSGAFYSTEEAAPYTILRLKDGMDTAQPSTNGTSVSNLFRLGAVLRDDRYTDLARETITAFEVETLQYPWLFLSLLSGVVAARLGVGSWVVLDGEKATEQGQRKFHSVPRAEPRSLVYLRRAAAQPNSWLLRRNPALRRLASGEAAASVGGIFEWRDGDYRPVAMSRG